MIIFKYLLLLAGLSVGLFEEFIIIELSLFIIITVVILSQIYISYFHFKSQS